MLLVTSLLLATLGLANSANFCPVEGSDYLDKPEGNMIKVKHQTQQSKDEPDIWHMGVEKLPYIL